MPGSILGIVGPQRSGKTLYAYKMTKAIYKSCIAAGYDLRVYTNLYCPADEGFTYINSLDDFPLDLEPKILLIDEIYNGCDSQDYKKLNSISIFINTLGKQNCLFIFTSIDAGMVYNRIRNQTQIFVFVKRVRNYIFYDMLFVQDNKHCIQAIEVNDQLFTDVNYDTNFIPLDFSWSMDSWYQKLDKYYSVNYNMSLKNK